MALSYCYKCAYNIIIRYYNITWTSYVHIIFIIFIFVKNIYYKNEYTIILYLSYNNLSIILIFIIIRIIFTLVEKKLIPHICLSKKPCSTLPYLNTINFKYKLVDI